MDFVKRQLDKFQKIMWSNEKPLLYAVEVFHRLLEENQRMRTVMSAALVEFENNSEKLEQTEDLKRLLENLSLERQDDYARLEFNQQLRQKLDFSSFEKGEN